MLGLFEIACQQYLRLHKSAFPDSKTSFKIRNEFSKIINFYVQNVLKWAKSTIIIVKRSIGLCKIILLIPSELKNSFLM